MAKVRQMEPEETSVASSNISIGRLHFLTCPFSDLMFWQLFEETVVPGLKGSLAWISR